jgi:hypothetical protein
MSQAQPEQPAAQGFLPYLSGSRSQILSGVQVQNLDTRASVGITMELHTQTGEVRLLDLGEVGSGAAVNVLVSERVQDEAAALIGAAGPIGAIVRHEWLHSGNGAAIYSDAKAATDVFLPLAARQFAHQCAIVTIQNTDAARPAAVTMAFRRINSSTLLTETMLRVPAGAALTRDLCGPGFEQVPDGFVGSIEIHADVPVAAQAMVYYDDSPGGTPVYAFEAVPRDQADRTLYVPLFRRDWYGTSGISVFNPSDEAVEVEIQFVGTLGSCAGRQGAQRALALPHSAVLFYQGDPSLPLPPGPCAGAATIKAATGVLAVVNEAKGGSAAFPDTAGAYNAVALGAASRAVALPLFRNEHLPRSYRLSTGVQVMNVGTVTATAELRVTASTGTVVACAPAVCRQAIAPGAAYTWYPPTMDGIPSNMYGSAMVFSTQPVVVIVNDESRNASLDSAMYNGLPAVAPLLATPTSPPTGTITATATLTMTATPGTGTPGTITPTMTLTVTATPTGTLTMTPVGSETATPTPQDSATPAGDTATPTATATATSAPETATPTATSTETPTLTPTSVPLRGVGSRVRPARVPQRAVQGRQGVFW